MFYKDYMMLIYPKVYLADKVHRRSKVIKVSDNNKDEDDNSSESLGDDLSDIDE